MNIIIILGSIREGRKSDRIARHLYSQLAQQTDLKVSLIDLQEVQIPMFDSRWQKVDNPNPALVEVGGILAEADGIILVSPEYHGSYTGVLKNCLDHYWGEFARKPIGVVATGSGPMGGINGSIQMQHLVLSLGAFPMPFKLLIPHISQTIDEAGTIHDEKVAQKVARFQEEFLWFARAIVHAKKLQPIS